VWRVGNVSDIHGRPRKCRWEAPRKKENKKESSFGI
jgi:hypothetical protein